MRRLKTKTVLVLGIFPILQLFPLQLPAHAYQSSWRKLSRHARVLVDDNNYQSAVEYYGKAIDELNRKEPGSQYVYDLMLNLAQTLILAHAYGRAEQVLNKIEPDITSRTFSDPLLPVRFWRRKSTLYYMQGDLLRAIENANKAFDIYGKHFSHSSELYQGQLRKLIAHNLEYHDWHQAAYLASGLKPAELTEAVDLFYKTMENGALMAMQAKDLDDSGQMLGALTGIDPHKNELISLWRYWSDFCVKLNQPLKTQIAKEKLQQLRQNASKEKQNLSQSGNKR